MIIIAFKVMIKLFLGGDIFCSEKTEYERTALESYYVQKSSFEIYYIDIISSAIASASKSR